MFRRLSNYDMGRRTAEVNFHFKKFKKLGAGYLKCGDVNGLAQRGRLVYLFSRAGLCKGHSHGVRLCLQ